MLWISWRRTSFKSVRDRTEHSVHAYTHTDTHISGHRHLYPCRSHQRAGLLYPCDTAHRCAPAASCQPRRPYQRPDLSYTCAYTCARARVPAAFWKLRQAEQEGYNLQYSPLKIRLVRSHGIVDTHTHTHTHTHTQSTHTHAEHTW